MHINEILMQFDAEYGHSNLYREKRGWAGEWLKKKEGGRGRSTIKEGRVKSTVKGGGGGSIVTKGCQEVGRGLKV